MPTAPKKWPLLALALALAAGAAFRLWFIHAYPEVQGDPLIYGDIAKNWMLHGIYGMTSGSHIDPTLARRLGPRSSACPAIRSSSSSASAFSAWSTTTR